MIAEDIPGTPSQSGLPDARSPIESRTKGGPNRTLGKVNSTLDRADVWIKRLGTLSAFIILLATIYPPLGNLINRITAERYGVHGIIKYELGNDSQGRRRPTENGQLYLIRGGPREFSDIRPGDIVQAISDINFRDDRTGCGASETCGSAPIIFDLRKGDCAIVIERSYSDDAPTNLPDASGLKSRLGGWLRVATAACGLFR